MEKKIPGFLFFAMVTIGACKNVDNQKELESSNVHRIEKANWLIGEWQHNSGTEKVAEVWEKENDTVYLGRSYDLRNTDTVSSERIRLEEHGDRLFYIPIVKNQNMGEVVKFILASENGNQLVFENPQHDFPQKISYTLITKDSLFAEISGMYKGKQESEKYPMHRIK
jgi:hypothetical protein